MSAPRSPTGGRFTAGGWFAAGAWLAACLACSTAGLPGRAHAKDYRQPIDRAELRRGIRPVGWIALHPYLRHTTLYTTNARNEPHRLEDHDVVLTTIAGLDAVLGTSEVRRLSLGYAAAAQTYLRHARLSTTEHTGRLELQVQGSRLKATLDGMLGYLVTPNDPRFTDQVRRYVGRSRLVATWQQSPVIALRAEGQAGFTDFRQRSLDFFDQWTWGVDAGVEASQLRLLAGGGYRELRYPDRRAVAPDLGLVSAWIGVNPTVTYRLTGFARVGYEWGQALVRRGVDRSASSPEGVACLVELQWTPRDATSISLTAERLTSFSSTAAYLRLTRAGLSVVQGLPFDLEAFGACSLELQEPRRDPRLRALTATIGLGWSPLSWLEVGVQAGYTSRRTRDADSEVLQGALSLTLQL